ncbi:MAG: winged-helix domain-containing protein [Dehalococcoidia bacterium]
MYSVLVIVGPEAATEGVLPLLEREGLDYTLAPGLEQEPSSAGEEPDAVLLHLESLPARAGRELVSRCRELRLPVIALAPAESPESYDPAFNADDFILVPFPRGELTTRIRQVLFRHRGPERPHTIKVGDLLIDTERYEVTIGGRRVLLTYKEYQLLLLLASNPGRVYSRETLLSRVWEYDYFGGTRTVDVHIRRLRSKIEDPTHSYIETVWNVGYRFKAPQGEEDAQEPQ